MKTAALNALLLELLVMLAVGVACGYVARKLLRQPRVSGELVGGVLLGPTVFGALFPAAYLMLFPRDPEVRGAFGAFIGVSMLFLLFSSGLEIEIDHLRKNVRAWVSTGVIGTLVPFAIGIGSVYAFPDVWRPTAAHPPLVFALVIGTAMSITAVPVMSRVLADLDLLRRPIGAFVMASATISDLIGWSMLAIILSTAGSPGESYRVDLWVWCIAAGLVAAFGLLLTRFGVPLATGVIRRMQERQVPGRVVMLYTAMLLGTTLLAQLLGIHVSLGAFIAGLALASVGQRLGRRPPRAIIEFTYGVFAPIYIVSIGLQADFRGSFDGPLVLLVLIVATVGKLCGATLGARIAGIPMRQSLAIGFGLNARGAMELVLASIALEAGLIGERVFVALVIMALVTSVLSGPAMRRLLGHRGDAVGAAQDGQVEFDEPVSAR